MFLESVSAGINAAIMYLLFIPKSIKNDPVTLHFKHEVFSGNQKERTGTKLHKYIDGHTAEQCSTYVKLPVQFLLLLLSRMYTTLLLCAQFAVVHSLFALFLVKVYGLYRWGKPRHVSETWGKQTLPSVATTAIPDVDTGDRAQDTAVEGRWSAN